MALFPSDEWLTIYRDRINASPEYREAAATWEGAVGFVFEAEPDRGVPEDLWLVLDLWHGECREARMVTSEEGERAPYLIRAPYFRWKEVVRGELDPVKGMMQGKLRLQGDLATIVRYVRAANELVHLTMQVPTEFLDEAPAVNR
ncbi:MAG TPA: SCP2 sterol-binding domain-containing protein [Actinomycetota bacterium]